MGNAKTKESLHSSSETISKSVSTPPAHPSTPVPTTTPTPDSVHQEPKPRAAVAPPPPKPQPKLDPVVAADPKKPDDFSFHLVIIGGKSAGKTSLLQRFTHDSFSETISPTEGVDFLNKSIMVGTKKVGLEIWDTTGEERTRVPSAFYQGANGVVAVYDVTSRENFQEIRKWLDDSERLSGSHPVRYLVGNKSDLERGSAGVSTEEGQAFAQELGLVFLETSAKTDHNVGELFQAIGTAIQNKK